MCLLLLETRFGNAQELQAELYRQVLRGVSTETESTGGAS